MVRRFLPACLRAVALLGWLGCGCAGYRDIGAAAGPSVLPPASPAAVRSAGRATAASARWGEPPAPRPLVSLPAVSAVAAIRPDGKGASLQLALPGALAYEGPARVAPATGPPPRLPPGAVARIGGPAAVPAAWRLSPRGNLFVGPSQGGDLSLCDARSRRRIAKVRTGLDANERRRARLAFSSDESALHVYVGKKDPPSVQTFSTVDGRRSGALQLPSGARELFFGPLARRAVVLFDEDAGRPVRVAVLDLATGATRQHELAITPAGERVAALSPDGALLLLTRYEPSPQLRARMVELPSGREIWNAEGGGYQLPAFSPDGAWVALGDSGGTAIRQARTGQLAYRRFEKFAAFAPDGRALLEKTGCLTERDHDGTARVRFEMPDNDSGQHVVVTGGGWVVLATMANQEMYWWERSTGRPLLLPAARLHGVRLAFSHDGQELLGDDGEYSHRWSARDGRPLDRRERWDSLVATANGQRLLAARGAAALDEVAAVGVRATALAENRMMQLSRDASRLLVTTIGGSAQDVVIDLRSGRTRPIAALGGNVVLSPDGELIAHFGESQKLVRSATGELIRPIAVGQGVELASGTFHPDGSQLAVVDFAGTGLWLLPLRAERPSRRLAIRGEVHSFAFSPDGRRLAIAYGDGSAEVRDLARDRTIQWLRGHREAIYALAFSPDGSRLATASRDGTALIWQLR